MTDVVGGNQHVAIRIVGTPVSLISMNRMLTLLESWVRDRRDRFVVLRDVHGVMRARRDHELRKAHEVADVVAPDGMPLVWAARAAGADGISRVCGPDLLPAACQYGVGLGWRHYFYGGAPGVAEAMVGHLTKAYPGIQIAGFYSPPFHGMSQEEDEAICAKIRETRPDFVWVGLGTPKQEIWMHEHRGRCGGATMLGIGAAFDIYAGATSRAPRWMQDNGLEWAHRLIHEPKRLWRRYLLLAPAFVVLALLDVVRGRVRLLALRPTRSN